jgi:hypothetical protein
LVKPILLYCSEVWCGFGHKAKLKDILLSKILTKDTTPFEQMNLALCKQSLYIPKHASNIGSRAELGRLPLMSDVITAVLKFNERFNLLSDSDLLWKASLSQISLAKNVYNTMTYSQFVKILKSQLRIHTELKNDSDCNKGKAKLNNFGQKVKQSCRENYSQIFNSIMEQKRNNPEDKLHIYSHVKRNVAYEN